nr:hypothetical protein [Tanacetum cinerariifolium]
MFVYTDSKLWRYYGEDSAETGPPRVIVYRYDGLLIQPVAPPSPDYVPGPEHPPSLEYVPGLRHPPSPIEIPYLLRYYGEDSAETGPPRVIVYRYDGLLIQPIAPPSPDYVPGPEHPPSLEYVPGLRHPPSPIEIPYVTELE